MSQNREAIFSKPSVSNDFRHGELPFPDPFPGSNPSILALDGRFDPLSLIRCAHKSIWSQLAWSRFTRHGSAVRILPAGNAGCPLVFVQPKWPAPHLIFS